MSTTTTETATTSPVLPTGVTVAQQLDTLRACLARDARRPRLRKRSKSAEELAHESAQDQRAEERKAGRYVGLDRRDDVR